MEATESVIKRPRGRPRKYPAEHNSQSSLLSTALKSSGEPKRPRGRPRKHERIESNPVKRGRGRPPRSGGPPHMPSRGTRGRPRLSCVRDSKRRKYDGDVLFDGTRAFCEERVKMEADEEAEISKSEDRGETGSIRPGEFQSSRESCEEQQGNLDEMNKKQNDKLKPKNYAACVNACCCCCDKCCPSVRLDRSPPLFGLRSGGTAQREMRRGKTGNGSDSEL